jgi:FG-GAP repeat
VDSGDDARFGWSVGAGDNKVIIGAPFDDDFCGDPANSACDAGVAFVFSRTHNRWTTDGGRLEPAGLAAGADFGYSVAMGKVGNNQFAVVGAPSANAVAGAAYVFYLDEGDDSIDPTDDTWVELSTLAGAGSGRFGHSVAIDDETIVVGAPSTSASDGAAYVFRHNGGALPNDPSDDTWDPDGTITVTPSGPLNSFGMAVSVSGDRIVVGSPLRRPVLQETGAAFVFNRSAPSVWGIEAELIASDGSMYEEFGSSVAIYGNVVVAGAPFTDGPVANDDEGAAYVYTRIGSVWSETTKLVSPSPFWNEFFGQSVSVHGDLMVVGADGSAFSFARSGSQWTGAESFTPKIVGDEYGASVSVGRNVLAVGTPADSVTTTSLLGSVVTYELRFGDYNIDGVLDVCDPEISFPETPFRENEESAGVLIPIPLDDDGQPVAGFLERLVPLVPKSRYISFRLPASLVGKTFAIRIAASSLNHSDSPGLFPREDYSDSEGRYFYVNPLQNEGGTFEFDLVPSDGTKFWVAEMGCEPDFRDWTAVVGTGDEFNGVPNTLHVTAASEMIPSSVYDVQLLRPLAGQTEYYWSEISMPLVLQTTQWSNVDSIPAVESVPNVADIVTTVDVVKLSGAYRRPNVNLRNPTNPEIVDVNNVVKVVDVVKGDFGSSYQTAISSSCQ